MQADTVNLPDVVPGDGCTVQKISYTNCSGNVEVIFYKVVNGGHSWPGATQDGTWFGNLNMDINAGVEIWNFAKRFILTPVTEIAADPATRVFPCEYSLAQNYPNPFNPSTTIRYGLPQRSHVTLTVFNTLGQQVAELVNREMEPGYHEVKFDASGLASGMYFYRLQAGTYVQTRKLLLLK